MNLYRKLSINRMMPILLILFPFIDLLNSVSTRFIELPVSPGIVIKGFIFLMFIFYIFKSLPLLFNEKSLFRLYIFIFMTIICSLVVNYFYKEPFSIVDEVMFDFKTVYFFVSLLTLHLWFKQNLKRTKFFISLVYGSIIYNLFIWGPYFLGVSFKAYKYEKAGSVGWFHSANEISGILACLFPIVAVLYFHKNEISKYLTGIATISFLPSFFIIGTKVSFAIGFVYSLIFAIITVYFAINNRKVRHYTLVAAVFIIYVFYQFNSPAVSNTEAHLAKEDEPEVSLEEDSSVFKIVDPDVIQYPEPTNPLINKILSDRDVYLKLHNNYLRDTLKESGTIRFLFGLGYASDYSIEPKQIEMDFFDLAFSYGFYFTVAFIFFVGIYLKKIIINLMKTKSFIFRCFSFLGVAIACGISFLTGHIIIAPAPSFYFALLITFASFYFYEKEKEITS